MQGDQMITNDPCPHSCKPCINRHDCERCKVPEYYGYFVVWHKGKSTWQQRFILDADRAAMIRHYDIQIIQAQTLRAAIEALPGKEEYERKSK